MFALFSNIWCVTLTDQTDLLSGDFNFACIICVAVCRAAEIVAGEVVGRREATTTVRDGRSE